MVGERIKNIRTEKGMSQEELAGALDVVRQTVSKWEKGLSAPDADMLVRLAHVLDTPVNELLGKEEPTVPVVDVLKKRTPEWWEIVLLVLGSPVWLSLAVAALAVALALYISLWAVIISLWAVFGSLMGCAFGGIVGGVIVLCNGDILQGIALMGASLVCAGLSVFLFFGCQQATKGILWPTKALVQGIKARFAKGGAL